MQRLITIVSAVLLALLWSGCSNNSKSQNAPLTHRHEHGHKTVHGGSLNAIVTCENGHVEAKLSDEKLHLWFVGGGHDTSRSVRIPDISVRLQVKTSEGVKALLLTPKPLELAGEKVGDCSHFEGTATWLKDLAEFTADGRVTFKGKQIPLRIEYPRGYDPD